MKRAGIAIVALLAGAALLFLARCHGEQKAAPARTKAAAPAALPTARVAGGEPQPESGDETLVPGYRITGVTLDRTHMCRNEDLRVQVSGEDPQGKGEYLYARVALPGISVDGNDVALAPGERFLAGAAPADGVTVELWDARRAEVVARRKVPFTIDECASPEAGLRVECAVDTPTPGELICQARGLETDGRATDFVPSRATWRVSGALSMGPSESEGSLWRAHVPPRVIHRLVDSAIVEVDATDAAGHSRHGRGTLYLLNTRYQTAELGGLLQLEVSHFTLPEPVGKEWRTMVEVTNPFDETVSLDEATLATFACGAKTPVTSTLPVATHMGRSSLAPGERIRFEWRLPQDPTRCDAQVTVKGRGSKSGKPASGLWVMPTDPTQRHQVTGAEQQKLLAAMEILSRRRGVKVSRVTQAELAELEAEGLLP